MRRTSSPSVTRSSLGWSRGLGHRCSHVRSTPTFAALVRSVTYQQLAGAAARAIHGRLIDALNGEVTPERILATPYDQLRAAGLSGNKVLSLQDLSAKVVDGTVVLDSRRLARESDEKVIAETNHGSRHRKMVRRYVPNVPASASRCVADWRSCGSEGVCLRMGYPVADTKTA